MSKTTYDDLVSLMNAEFNCFPNGSFAGEISYLLDAARINADDTMQEGTDQSWEAIAMATIEMQLAYSKDKAVQDWFANNGVKW